MGVPVGVGVGVERGFRVIAKPSQLPAAVVMAVSAGGVVPALAITLSPSNEAHWLWFAVELVRSDGPPIVILVLSLT